jgi:hypothetical protein
LHKAECLAEALENARLRVSPVALAGALPHALRSLPSLHCRLQSPRLGYTAEAVHNRRDCARADQQVRFLKAFPVHRVPDPVFEGAWTVLQRCVAKGEGCATRWWQAPPPLRLNLLDSKHPVYVGANVAVAGAVAVAG